MIKKSVHEDDIIAGMQIELAAHNKVQGISNLVQAADYLQAAMDIFEDAGMTIKSDEILNILTKIAYKNTPSSQLPSDDHAAKPISDPHTKGLTSKKMVENLKHNGIVFNMADDAAADDLLDLDIDDKGLEITDGTSYQKDFEDEE